MAATEAVRATVNLVWVGKIEFDPDGKWVYEGHRETREGKEKEKNNSCSTSRRYVDANVCKVCCYLCSQWQLVLLRTSFCALEMMESMEQCEIHARFFSLKVSPFQKKKKKLLLRLWRKKIGDVAAR